MLPPNVLTSKKESKEIDLYESLKRYDVEYIRAHIDLSEPVDPIVSEIVLCKNRIKEIEAIIQAMREEEKLTDDVKIWLDDKKEKLKCHVSFLHEYDERKSDSLD